MKGGNKTYQQIQKEESIKKSQEAQGQGQNDGIAELLQWLFPMESYDMGLTKWQNFTQRQQAEYINKFIKNKEYYDVISQSSKDADGNPATLGERIAPTFETLLNRSRPELLQSVLSQPCLFSESQLCEPDKKCGIISNKIQFYMNSSLDEALTVYQNFNKTVTANVTIPPYNDKVLKYLDEVQGGPEYKYKTREQFNQITRGKLRQLEVPFQVRMAQQFPYKVVAPPYGCLHDFADTTTAFHTYNLLMNSHAFETPIEAVIQNPNSGLSKFYSFPSNPALGTYSWNDLIKYINDTTIPGTDTPYGKLVKILDN